MFSHYLRFNRFGQKLLQHRAKLHRMAVAWCGDTVLADDLVQETLTRALENHTQLRDEERLDAWLYRILHNGWMEHLRTRKPWLNIDDVELPCTSCPEQQVADDQLAEQVRAAIATLPISHRQIMTLVDLEGCSYAQVAAILDIPPGTVMSRLSRARQLLKTRLQTLHTPDNVHYLRRTQA